MPVVVGWEKIFQAECYQEDSFLQLRSPLFLLVLFLSTGHPLLILHGPVLVVVYTKPPWDLLCDYTPLWGFCSAM